MAEATSKARIQNAIIKTADLSVERAPILVDYIVFEGDGWGQGLGGYCLGKDGDSNDPANGFACAFIVRFLKAVGVESWSKLPGTPVRVRRDDRGFIDAVGHFVKEDWFVPKDIAAEFTTPKGGA